MRTKPLSAARWPYWSTTNRACWPVSWACSPGRGYNIDSLTVAEVDASSHQSRITIVTQGTPHILEQIEAHLMRLVPVGEVVDITKSKRGIERELALVESRRHWRQARRSAAHRPDFPRQCDRYDE